MLCHRSRELMIITSNEVALLSSGTALSIKAKQEIKIHSGMYLHTK
jgi:hypothetical protein